MIPPSFEYLTPSNISDAVALLQKHGDEAKILAGGHSLIPAMRLRLAEPGYLIDISGIGGLDYIQEESGQLRIGAMTCEAALEESEIVQSKYPLILDTAKMIADPSVRNMATVGGNLAHGDPANDHPATMLALRASVVAEGPNGTREIKIDDFFPDFFTTALAEDEILTEIRIPSPPSASGGAYLKIERKVGDYAAAAVACQLNIDSSGSIENIGLGLTNVGSTPIRASSAEELLKGKKPDENMLAEAGLSSTVTFTGNLNRPQLARMFSLHHVGVFPSIYPEAFGITGAEIQASGLVLVSSGVGGSAELIENGVTGLTFQTGDAQDLAAKLFDLSQHPEKMIRLARNGQQRIRDRFSVVSSTTKLERMFYDLQKKLKH